MTPEMIQTAELAPIVVQIIDRQQIDSLDWQMQSIAGVGGSSHAGGLGLVRLTGTAESEGETHPWSLVVKRFNGTDAAENPDDTSRIPSAWDYWKREILAYESGILTDLTGTLVAPRCYAVTQHGDDEWRLWMEDVQEASTSWTMAHHGLAAKHLGQFNGAYLTTRELPALQPWFTHGRTRLWIETVTPLFERFRNYADSSPGNVWLSQSHVDRKQRLLDNRHSLVAALDNLPVTFCHHDGFCRNLILREDHEGYPQTVAVDWSMLGYGAIGEDPAISMAMALSWLEVDANRAREFDQTIFDAYIDGLRDAGWQGNERLARFGYTAAAALAIGVAMAVYYGTRSFSTPERTRDSESIVGASYEEMVAHWAVVQPFLLDLGDEALQLMDELW